MSKSLKYKYPLILVLLSVFLAVVNYKSGTWLSGWDNLHPEFNFGTNIERTVFSAWQEFQGLGLPSAMAHASDLPRIIILWVLSLFFEVSILRYLWQFLMLTIGPLGVYVFVKRVVASSKPSHSLIEFLAFCSGLYYLLNLATLQNFFAPQSMFTTQYGFLPWLLLYFFEYLSNFDPRTLLKYVLVSLLAATQAFTTTLILSYFLLLGITFLYFLIRSRFNLSYFKKSLGIIFGTAIINLFWLVPFAYFLMTGAPNVPQASINTFSSDESFYLNKKYGTLRDVSVLRGFWFENTDFDVAAGGFRPMFGEWLVHQENPVTAYTGHFLAILVVLGVIFVLIDRKEMRYRGLFLSFLALSAFFLFNANPPFEYAFLFLQEKVPFFKEAFRFPFTKFSIISAFSYSIFFGFGTLFVLRGIKRLLLKAELLMTAVFIGFCVLWTLPAFSGNLISQNLKINIPSRYFELFDWFSEQDDKSRILNLPMYAYWAWPYYDWGYRGSGFLWYGIKQPILDRAFDVWNPKNEEAYWQISQALYSEDMELFASLLDKYAIKWLLVDESIFVPGRPNSEDVLGFEHIKNLVESSAEFNLAFRSGAVKVFEYKNSVGLVSFSSDATSVSESVFANSAHIRRSDSVYANYRTYFYSGTSQPSIEFPFSDGSELSVQDYEISLVLKGEIERNGGKISVPNPLLFNDALAMDVYVNGNEISLQTIPISISSGGKKFGEFSYVQKTSLPSNITPGNYVRIGESYFRYTSDGKIGSLYLSPSLETQVGVYAFNASGEENITRRLSLSELGSCGLATSGSYSAERTEDSILLRGKNNTACVVSNLEKVYQPGSVIQVAFDYDSFASYPKYCLFDSGSGECLNEEEKYSGIDSQKGSISDFVLLENIGRQPLFHLYLSPSQNVDSSILYSNVLVKEGRPLFVSNVLPVRDFVAVSNPVDAILTSNDISVEIPVLAQDPRFFYSEEFSKPEKFSYDNICVLDQENPFIIENGVLKLYSKDSESCFYTKLGGLKANSWYLVEFDSKRVLGKDQRLCVLTSSNDRCGVPYKVIGTDEWHRNRLLVPTFGSQEEGFSLLVNNTSIGDEATEYEYDNLKVLPLPHEWLNSIEVVKEAFGSGKEEKTERGLVNKSFTGNLYSYKLESKKIYPGLLILNQTFDRFWVAMCGFRICDAEHVMVNGWANGWNFTSEYSGQVRLIYILSYLQIFTYILILGYIGRLVAAAMRYKDTPEIAP